MNFSSFDLEYLFVDDNVVILDIMVELLKLTGIPEKNILTAENGKLCLQKIKDNPDIKFIFLDINMPIMNGFETAEELRKDNYSGTIIAITGMVGYDYINEAFRCGINYLCNKPITMKSLKKIIDIEIENENENNKK